jgi:alpha-mannosidase
MTTAQARSFFAVDNPAVVIDTVKRAEDSDALVVRLYEAHGSRARVRLTSPLAVRSARQCNLLEDEQRPLAWSRGGVRLTLRPFEIVTLKLTIR